jgi:hypothetical protein
MTIDPIFRPRLFLSRTAHHVSLARESGDRIHAPERVCDPVRPWLNGGLHEIGRLQDGRERVATGTVTLLAEAGGSDQLEVIDFSPDVIGSS